MNHGFGNISRIRITTSMIGFLLAVAGVIAFWAPPSVAADTHVPITGGGSTWVQNALDQWRRNVQANYGWKITYEGSGSTQGRSLFAKGQYDFGTSEIPYNIANSNEHDNPPNRAYAYLPDIAGGTAFMYNLKIGGKRVTNLRLSGEVLARIFTNDITMWNDTAIRADNPGLAMPATPIVPVVRSDGAGESAQMSMWMRQEQAKYWDAYCPKVGRSIINGHCGVTSNWPIQTGSRMVGKVGSNGVAGYVAGDNANGSITFVNYSYALNSGFPVVKMLNSSGYYIEPTPYAVAVSLLAAKVHGVDDSTPASDVNYLTQDLSGVYGYSDKRTYPLSSYSYVIIPLDNSNNFSNDKGVTLGDFLAYDLCEGQQQAESLGYSPLPVNLVKRAQGQVMRIPGASPYTFHSNPNDISKCNNPTLDPNNPDGNALATKAPMPSECDKKGQTQCASGTGGSKNVATELSGAGAGAGGAGGSGGSGAGGDDAAATGEGANAEQANADEETGVLAAGDESQAVVAQGVPQTLPIDEISTGRVGAAAAITSGVGLIGASGVPPLVGSIRRKQMVALQAELKGESGGFLR